MNKHTSHATNAAGSTLAQGIAITGQIKGDGDLTIQGLVQGEISIEGELRVTEQAEVRARVHAASAFIEGVFDGDLVTQGPVRAGAGASLRGTVQATGLSVEQGAKVSVTIANEFELPAELGKTSR